MSDCSDAVPQREGLSCGEEPMSSQPAGERTFYRDLIDAYLDELRIADRRVRERLAADALGRTGGASPQQVGPRDVVVALCETIDAWQADEVAALLPLHVPPGAPEAMPLQELSVWRRPASVRVAWAAPRNMLRHG